jgi:hypothetical protein
MGVLLGNPFSAPCVCRERMFSMSILQQSYCYSYRFLFHCFFIAFFIAHGKHVVAAAAIEAWADSPLLASQ